MLRAGRHPNRRHHHSVQPERIAFTIDGPARLIENEARRLRCLPHIDQVLVEVMAADRNGFQPSNIRSGIREWAETRDYTPLASPTPPVCPPSMRQDVPLASRVEGIAMKVMDCDVLLIEAPTGAGKSVIMPTVMQYVAESAEHDKRHQFTTHTLGTGWKVIHVSPTSEQAVQNMEWVNTQHSREFSNIHFGVYTSAVCQRSGLERQYASPKANYVYATTFYGEQALGGILHAVVIDDVHELTPETIRLLCRVRQEFCCHKRDRRIFKLILMSATLSESNRQMLMDYYERVDGLVVQHLKYNDSSPFKNDLLIMDDDNQIMRAAMRGDSQEKLFRDEADHLGVPNIATLKARSVAVQVAILKEIMGKTVLPNPPGIISFHPGHTEVSRARAALCLSPTCKELKLTRSADFKLYRVSGSDRADLEILKQPHRAGDPMQIIHSTPLLSYGVTLPGIRYVIDDGTTKLPGPYSRAGVVELMVRFEDKNMMLQKRGRVSRIADGIFIIVVSKLRYEVIQHIDHTLERLDRSYRTNNDPSLFGLSSHLLMIPPETATLDELRADMFNTGLAHKALGTFEPTTYAKLLGRTFACLPLVLSDFVIRCSALGVGLHGIVFAASCCTEHRVIRRASSAGAGRDDRELPMNRWPVMTGERGYSDVEQLAEMALNLILRRPAVNFIPDGCGRVFISYSEGIEDQDAADHFFRRVVVIFNSIRALGCGPKDVRGLFEELKGSYELCKSRYDGCKSSTSYRLKKRQRMIFSACLLSSLGSRVLYEICERDQESHGERRMFVLSDEKTATLVQGERAWNSRKTLAIYHEVVRRASHEQFLTGMLHYATPIEYALYGNAIGSERDEVDHGTNTLKISTNTAPIFIKFNDNRTLRNVLRIRKIMRTVPIAAVMRGERSDEFISDVRQMVLNLAGNGVKTERRTRNLIDEHGSDISTVSCDGSAPVARKNGAGRIFYGKNWRR